MAIFSFWRCRGCLTVKPASPWTMIASMRSERTRRTDMDLLDFMERQLARYELKGDRQ